MAKKLSNEYIMFVALETIAKNYETSSELRKSSKNNYGLDYEEALEMAYDNIQSTAKSAIKGIKRPNRFNKEITPPQIKVASNAHALEVLGEEQFKRNKQAVKSISTDFKAGIKYALNQLKK